MSTDLLLPGAMLGPFSVEERIGEGGSSAVYRASRTEPTFVQRAAVKVLRGALTPARRAAFSREQAILAALDHPSIARFFSAAAPDDGVAWFAMELVEGRLLLQYCDEHGLALDDRLRLFRHACTAVGYAHHRNVVHLDLKQSNILVTRDGLVKLVDFGVARRFDPTSHAQHDSGQGPVSLAYASPEQVTPGALIGKGSDIYSLGVVLYQLLTGHLPYRLPAGARDDAERSIREGIVMPPSEVVSRPVETATPAGRSILLDPERLAAQRVTTPARLRQLLAGNLDRMVARALQKEPDQRYATVTAFVEDIDSHLQGRTIQAASESWLRQMAALIRRRPMAACAIVALGVGAQAAFVAPRLLARATAEQQRRSRVGSEISERWERTLGADIPRRLPAAPQTDRLRRWIDEALTSARHGH